jgi:hypothetical protein
LLEVGRLLFRLLSSLDPWLISDMYTQCFFPKSRSQLGKMRLGEADPFADSDDDTLIYKVRRALHESLRGLEADIRALQAKKVGEVEVEPGFSHTQQIGIAMACLIEDGNQRLVDFVRDVRAWLFKFVLSLPRR